MNECTRQQLAGIGKTDFFLQFLGFTDFCVEHDIYHDCLNVFHE